MSGKASANLVIGGVLLAQKATEPSLLSMSAFHPKRTFAHNIELSRLGRRLSLPPLHFPIEVPQFHRPVASPAFRHFNSSTIIVGFKLAQMADVAAESVHEIQSIPGHNAPPIRGLARKWHRAEQTTTLETFSQPIES